MKKIRWMAAALGAVFLPAAFSQTPYTPAATFCASGGNALCSTLPGYIGTDPALKALLGYKGIFNPAASAADDVQSPFDNMAWQSFVALNWVNGAPNQPAKGLVNTGTRIWQTWPRVENVFGNGEVTPSCANPSNLPVFTIASKGNGIPSPNNEEYLQASTNLPIIDINGNWTLYERRLNNTEAQYIKAPNNSAAQNLNTVAGQNAFIKAGNTVSFPVSATQPAGTPGAIEIKAAWRILDPAKGDDPARYFNMQAQLQVAGDLVKGGTPICETVTVGLVGMHIIQKNPVYAVNPALLNQWIWASFEHVDNAPPAATACDPTGRTQCPSINQASCGAAVPAAGVRYSYFIPSAASSTTNLAPVATSGKTAFQWNNSQPYAGAYQKSAGGVSPQAARCWQIYSLTQSLNGLWQGQLNALNSVFANYMLVGTQWGGNVEPAPGYQLPANAVPGLLSNITLETYIQNYTKPVNNQGPGSCIGCHSFATLTDNKTASDFSFLPSLASPNLIRKVPVK